MKKTYTIITGGMGGLGSAFAQECAHQGKHLILIDRHEQGGDLINYIQDRYDVDVEYYACDLSDANARFNLYQEFKKSNIDIAGLFNVVGCEFEGAFQERTRDEMMQLINLNIGSMVDMTYHALHMRAPSERFMLVNVSSLAGFFPMPYKAVYSSTKRFIINYSLALWKEIESFGNVTVLCPAGLPTNAESMKKIFLQGFWGKITAQDTSVVVRKTITKVQKNIPVYIPGLPNKLMVLLARLLHERMLAAYLAKRWSGKQEELEIWRISDEHKR